MFRNYFKTAIRNLLANKVYSIITVAGLGVGIAVCLVIFIFIRYEQSYDNFHRSSERIYRILTRGDKTGENENPTAAVPFPLPTAMENDLPDWKTTGIFFLDNVQFAAMGKDGRPEKKFKEKDGVYMVEPSFFTIFDYPRLAGDPVKSLSDRNSIVLTRSMANKYFGEWQKAMGRTVRFGANALFNVTGILEDFPANTDIRIKAALPYASGNFSSNKDWWTINGSHGTYVLLPNGLSVDKANQQLKTLSKKYRTPDNKNIQVLQSIAEVHFDAVAGNYSGKTITADRIRTLWMIAGFILLIACVNFINISTAQAVNRAKEVGVRKVLGGRRGQLTLQFILEAFLLVTSSVLLASVLTGGLLTPISKMLDIPVNFGVLREAPVLLFLVAVTVAVTLLAGFYPALVLSSFNPITALKTKLAARSAGGITLRRGLVVLQFVIAQALIIGTLLMIRQMDYFQSIPMGFNKEALVTVPFPGDSASRSRIHYLRDQLVAIKGVRQVSFNNTSPADQDNWWTGFRFDHAEKDTKFASISKWVDANYVPTYGLPLVAGRNITATDSVKEFLVNETLVRKLGFSNPHDVLNKEINLWNGFAKGPIVGVVKDFHQSSLRDSLSPVFMLNFAKGFNAAGIRLAGSDVPGTLHSIERLWANTYPDFVYEYQFLDEKIADFYKEEARLSGFYKIFALIAIFLSCLGLYGLASFMATQRLKEVGIRKVLGATAANIVYLFSKEFVALVAIAFLLSTPIAWYFVHQWLLQYVYRISISGWIFVFGGALALLVALATVSFQAFRAAAVNPVKNLRTE
ncbi:ABC transporter permease [Puia sp. P3]|uniref:ABC transporter permease n=1 Tax=Puia sp. P3 TaxID=3423952 RepID=UPI003D676DDB